MFFLDALGVWVIYAFGIGTLVWAVAFIIGAVIVLRQRKKEEEEWERTEGAEQRRINDQLAREMFERLNMGPYVGPYEEEKRQQEEKMIRRKARKPIDTEFEKWQRSNQ